MFTPRITNRRLADFCRRLGTMLRAGIDIRKSLRQEAAGSRGQHRLMMQKLADGLDRGEPLSELIASTGPYFPRLIQPMVAVGETSGHLDQVLLELSKHYDLLEASRKEFFQMISKPVIQLLIALAIIGGVIWISGSISSQTKTKVDILGFGLTGTSGLVKYIAILTGIATAIAVTVSAMRRGLMGGGIVFRLIRRIPVVGKCLSDFSLGRLAWSLALTTNTSMSLQESLRIAFESAGDPYLHEALPEILTGIRQGKEVHVCFAETNRFPFEFLAPLEVGETTGMFSEGAQRLADQYQASAQHNLMKLSQVAGTAIWLMILFFIAMLVLSMASSYIGTINSLL
jgi:type IV pilus assembly protein PilC